MNKTRLIPKAPGETVLQVESLHLVPTWRLVAIALDPENPEPALYALIRQAAPDAPLMIDDRIAVFRDKARAAALISEHGGAWARDSADIEAPTLWCDVAQTLHLLSEGGIDDSSSVVDAINVLLDLVNALGTPIGERRKQALHAMADYCTFHKDVTRYLEEEGDYSSQELVDAVLWCVGAVVVKARIV